MSIDPKTFPIPLEALSQLDMHPERSGLVWVNSFEGERAEIRIHLEQAQRFGADAVYFRYFADGRPPRPQVYLYEGKKSQEQIRDLHKKLWNAVVVPVGYFVSDSEVQVINCLDGKGLSEEDKEEYSVFDTIKLAGKTEKLRQYSSKRFDSGLFWEKPPKGAKARAFNASDNSFEQLLKQLKALRKKLVSERKFEAKEKQKEYHRLVKRVLVMIILIKYLEDRKDRLGNGALDATEVYPDFLPKNQSPTLGSVIQNQKDRKSFRKLLQYLESKEQFNGGVFAVEQEELFDELPFDHLASFADGDISFAIKDKTAIGQKHLWELYDFAYLPIELISHIYEDFLEQEGKKASGVVYTPPYLVQFLVDQCLPLGEVQEQVRVLDPACGSGIFLVGVYKRLIQAWRVRNGWVQPEQKHIPELQKLLKQSIYGGDINPEAVELTYFSLCLALLDALSPKEIWGNVHFENLLGSNLQEGDFFKHINDRMLPNDFDLVIGNPPFKSKLTEDAGRISKQEQETLKAQEIIRPEVPDQQIALLFLEQGLKLTKEGGKCCMILSAGPLIYNHNTFDFRKYLFQRFHFEAVFDFVAQRQSLFKGSSSSAAPAAIAALAKNSVPTEDDQTYHIILRRSRSSKDKVEFETDYYDFHILEQEDIQESPKVWHLNFMGGGRLYHFYRKLEGIQSLGEFLKKKVKHDGWAKGEGWIESPNHKDVRRVNELSNRQNLNPSEVEEFERLRKKYFADWIYRKEYIPTKSFPDLHSIKTCNIQFFERRRIPQLFEPPHLLVKESSFTEGLKALYSDKYLTFRDKIIGIHAPKDSSDELKTLHKYLSSQYLTSLLWLSSSQAILQREGVSLLTEFLGLPYSEKPLEFQEDEKILLEDILEYQVDFRTKGENSHVLDPVEDGLLEQYADIYCKVMNSLYKGFKPLKAIKSEEFICMPFVYGDEPSVQIPASMDEVEEHLSTLINHQASDNLWIRRILRAADGNVAYFFKPNQKRYWTRSIAMRDASDTFSDLLEQPV